MMLIKKKRCDVDAFATTLPVRCGTSARVSRPPAVFSCLITQKSAETAET